MSNAKIISQFSAADRQLVVTFVSALQNTFNAVQLELLEEIRAHGHTKLEVERLRREIADLENQLAIARVKGRP